MPDISPSRGEIGCHECFRQFSTLKNERGAEIANLPLEGEMPGRAEGGAGPPAHAIPGY
ncbi:propionyl-coenzyme A carboxylase alpha polypeptide [Mesorhizobium sp. B3-2-1]|nr:propionyl-coenzyme A carboxylase alpha polypeptide [Mesorhizobium sp. B3-2-1]